MKKEGECAGGGRRGQAETPLRHGLVKFVLYTLTVPLFNQPYLVSPKGEGKGVLINSPCHCCAALCRVRNPKPCSLWPCLSVESGYKVVL